MSDPPGHMGKKARALFVYLEESSFVEADRVLLEHDWQVRPFHFAGAGPASPVLKALRVLASWARQIFWLIREVPRCQLVFGWFADYHLVFPVLLGRLFRKPVVVALGGYDCIHLPSLAYGVYHSRWRRPLARYVVRRCSLLLPCSRTLIEASPESEHWPEAFPNGLTHNVGSAIPAHRVLYWWFDEERWRLGPSERQPVVCTVGYAASERTFLRKGMDLVLDVARELPEARFQVVGVSDDLLPWVRERFSVPDNVTILPPQSRDELPGLYARASVYLQLSRAEGLPNVLCEAMLCGCIPVGSAVFGIPETIGATGYVAKTPDPRAIADLVRRALGERGGRRRAARERIVSNFNFASRRAAMASTLDQVLRR